MRWRGRFKGALAFIDFFYFLIEEKVLVSDLGIEYASHFILLAYKLPNLPHSHTHEFSAHPCLYVNDSAHDQSCIPIDLLSKLAEDMALILDGHGGSLVVSARGQIMLVFI